MGLRGAVSEADVNSALLNGNGQSQGQNSQDAPAQYDPMSTGAIPDAADADLFSLPANVDDPFADEALPAGTYRPLTARQRLQAQRAAAENLPQPPKADLTTEVDDEDVNGPALRAATVDTQENPEIDQRAQRVRAIEGLRRTDDDHPFEAVGIRIGSFVLRSSLEQGLTATSNASLSHGGSSAVLSETAVRFNAVSDWRSNSAAINMYGNLRRTLSGEVVKDSQIGIDGRLDVDLGNDLSGHGAIGYLRGPETASSAVVINGSAYQPIQQTVTGSLGVEKGVGKARFGMAGRVERDMFDDANLSSGDALSQKDRDSTLAALALRGGYEISPALTPFVEVEVGRRFYTNKVDQSGYERSSNLFGSRAGVAIDLGEKLSGEFSAGWLRESFDDSRLSPVSTPSIAAALAWSPERGTIVNLAGTTTIEDTTTVGESGSVLYAATLSAERLVRANLTANAALGVGYRNYSNAGGHDVLFSAEAGATWWLNRYTGLTGRLRHESQKSSLPDRDYDANSVFVGLTLQR